ncbi:MAG: peptidoglycan-binding domain-containing protein [Elainellaceae cyanobacterium]
MNLTCFDSRLTTPRSRSGAHSSSIFPSQAMPSLNTQFEQAVAALEPDPLMLGDRHSAVQNLQIALKALDFYTGSLDNTFGPKTADAVQRFQQSDGIAATGEFDAATWYALTFWAQPA